jgi:excisionase family DNA binding protein
MATSRIHEAITGHSIEYPEPSGKLLALAKLILKLEGLLTDAKKTEEDLVALIYSGANPLLEPSPVGGSPLVTKETLARPEYRVLLDLLERKRIAVRKIDVTKIAAGYTLTVAQAAERLGIHESAVRQAIAAGRLASWIRDGRTMLHPKWVDLFAKTALQRERASLKQAHKARSAPRKRVAAHATR